MTIDHGLCHSLVSGQELEGTSGTHRAVNPANGTPFGPSYTMLTAGQAGAAAAAAHGAFPSYRQTTPDARARFLRAIAKAMEGAGPDIVDRAMSETGLPASRLQGELARTLGQLRLFATVLEQGDYLGVRIETARPERTPVPRPDLRQRKVPLGPVIVFGASNFPLAFSVAGGDTASALAAGCPVVFKAHEAHPGTSLLVARAIAAAAQDSGIHPGVFSLVYGRGSVVGQALVADPQIKAVAFTGSRAAGTAIMHTASTRPEPIPVYAEMSAVNPLFVLPSALAAGSAELARGFVSSLTGSAGQLCTVPGLMFAPSSPEGDRFVADVAGHLETAAGTTMLTESICSARINGEAQLREIPGVTRVAVGRDGETKNAPAPAVYSVEMDTFVSTPALAEEIFGSVCLVVRYRSEDDLFRAVDSLEGQLTATVHLATNDVQDVAMAGRMLEALELKVGRLLFNGWPTGVDVGEAMVHGGPFPATSDSRTTSVGTLAIERFLRPVVIQNAPESLLPASLRDDNPWGLTRRVDGRTTATETALTT